MVSRRWVLVVVAIVWLAPLLQQGEVQRDGTVLEGSDPPGGGEQDGRPQNAGSLMASMRPCFIENLGQLGDPGVRFYAMGDPLSVLVTAGGVTFVHRDAGMAEPTAFTMWLEGADAVVPDGRSPLECESSFIHGKDPTGWVYGARSFSEVVYQGILPGVGMRLYFVVGMLKYDIMLARGIDPLGVDVVYEGIEGLGVDGDTGDLLIRTSAGTLRDSRPVLLQEGRTPIVARYRPDEAGWCVEPLGEVDPALPLVIDPGLEFSTRIGGSYSELYEDIIQDAEGNIIIIGQTYSDDFPIGGERPGESDIFMMRFTDVTRMPISAMYIGGSEYEWPSYISTVLEDGRLLLVGYTNSSDFPTTPDAYQRWLGGGYDRFLTVIAADWSKVEYSTLLGGSEDDRYDSWLVLGDGELLYYSSSKSRDIPTTEGSFCETIPEHYPDYNMYYLLCLALDPPEVAFCTYLTGENTTIVDKAKILDGGDILLAGRTRATDLPTTSGCLSDSLMGKMDVYCARLAPDGSLVYATYIGGSESEGLDREASVFYGDSLFMTGYTSSTDFLTTPGAHRQFLFGPWDAYLVRYDIDSNSISYSTYFGGNDYDWIDSLIPLPNGELSVIGQSYSNGLPITSDALDSRDGGKLGKTFLARFNGTTGSLLYCSYFGGGNYSSRPSYLPLPGGNILLYGWTNSTDFPTTDGAFQTEVEGRRSLYLTEMTGGLDHIVHSTLVGGASSIYARDILRLDNGSLCVLGSFSGGESIPTTSNALCSSPEGGYDLMLLVMDDDLSHLEYGTIIGGDVNEEILRIEVSEEDMLAITIETNSTLVNTTFGCFDPVKRSDSQRREHYVLSFDLRDLELVYASYFGTPGNSNPSTSVERAIFIDRRTLALFGFTYSEYYPTCNATFESDGTTSDCFIAMLGLHPCGLPSTPTNVTAEGSDGLVMLNWDRPIHKGGMVLAHRIYRGTSPNELTPYALLTWHDSDITGFNDVNVTNGEEYYYEVRAVNSRGEGGGGLCHASPIGHPTPPLNVVATSGDGTITLTWDPPTFDGGSEILGYRVFKGPNRDEMQLIAYMEATETTWVDTDVSVGEFYYYAVIAYNELGESLPIETIRAKVTDVPSRPPGFDAVAGDGMVTLSWNYPASNGGTMIVGFYVWRMTEGNQMMVYATLGAAQLGFVDTNVTNGVQYTYMVSAFTNVGEGAATEAVDATPFGPPGEVVLFEASPGVGEVVLEWSPPEDDGGSIIRGYTISWGTEQDDLDQEQKVGSISSLTHTGLDNGVTYYYRIQAENAAGLGPLSIVVYATPMGLPGPVGDLTVEAMSAGVRITWSAPSEMGGVDTLTYRVLRGDTDDPSDLLVELVDAFAYLDENVAVGTTYYYRVVAISSMGEGDRGAVVHVTVAGVPAKIDDLEVNVSNAMVTLVWSAPGDDGGSAITEYVVLRGVFEDTLAEVGRTATPGYSDDTVENGATYYYRVYAVNAIGAGERSELLSVKPLGPPGSPGVLEAKTKGSAIVLTWAAPAGGNMAPVTGYKVYRGESEFEMELLTVVGLERTYTDGTVKEDRDYYYKVVATSDSGDSEMSRLAKARVKSEEEPGFGVVLAVLAMMFMIAVLKWFGRRRT